MTTEAEVKPLTPEQVRRKHKIYRREVDAANDRRRYFAAQVVALQQMCPHETWCSTAMIGWTKCEDCHIMKIDEEILDPG